MRNKGDLHARLDVIENKLISPLDRRIATLSPADRAIYDAWRKARAVYYKQFPPGGLYAAHLDGEAGPVISRPLARQLFPRAPVIREGDDAQEIWRRAVDGDGR